MKTTLVNRGRDWILGGLVALVGLVVFGVLAVTAFAGSATSAQGLAPPLPACSTLDALGIPMQVNLRASSAMIACGRAAPGEATQVAPVPAPPTPGVNVDVITGGETYPHVTQSEDQVFAH